MFGGGGVGKTALVLRCLRNQFVEEYIPTLADDFRHDMVIGKETIHLEIIDTAGQDDFREMRSHFYQSVQGFVLVYSINDKHSLMETEEIYKDICACVCKPEVPAVLLGNKADLRDDDSVKLQDGIAMAKKLGARMFETSAKTGANVQEAFKAGVQVVHEKLFPATGGCCEVM
jgi:GTPase KRas protein